MSWYDWDWGVPRYPSLQGLCHSVCVDSPSTCMQAESVLDNLDDQMIASGGNSLPQELLKTDAQYIFVVI